MVRQCQADSSVSEYAQYLLQQRIALEVGVLVGRLGTSRDHILFLVKTPAQDGEQPVAAEDGVASMSAVTLRNEWISEHAAQVTRMLPGGIAVMGAYLLASEKAFTGAAPQLCGLAKALRAEAGDDSLLLHIDAATGKTSLKEYAGGAPSGAAGLKPVELRFVALRQAFQTLLCSLDVDMTVPVPKGGASLCSRFSSLIQQQAARINAGTALFDGRLLVSSSPLADVLPQDAADAEPQRFELLCPPACAAAGTTAATSVTVGRVRVAGRLEGLAFVPRREPVAAAVAALQADLVDSLRARLESVEEDAEAMVAEANLTSHPLLSRPSPIAIVAPVLPARIFLPTQAGVPVCEYQLEADSLTDVVARARELLGSRLVAEGTAPAGAEQGPHLQPPAAPWAPLQEQDTQEPTPPKASGLLQRLPWSVTLLLLIVTGVVASLAALPLSRLILDSEYLSSRP